MARQLVRPSLLASLLIGLGLSGAQAAATRPMLPEALGLGSAATPVAMCGFRCRYGGRYIPGPPSVCYVRSRAQLLWSFAGVGWPKTLGGAQVLWRGTLRTSALLWRPV